MNGKQCKKLRKLAQYNTIGQLEISYTVREHVKLARVKGGVQHVSWYQVYLTPGCTRHEYQHMKKAFKESRHAS